MTVLHTRTRKPVARVAGAPTGFRHPARATGHDPFPGPALGVPLSTEVGIPRTLGKGIIILHRSFVVSVSVSMLGAALLAGAPTARAETISLDNGLSVDTGVERPDGSRL